MTPSLPPTSGAVLGTGPSTLACADGLESAEQTDPFLDNGPLGGLVNSSILSQSAADLPLARDVNLTTPDNANWLFRKSPIWLAAGTEAITVSVPDDGQQFLVWTTAAAWTGGTSPTVADWAQTSVTIQSCPGHPVSFFGGVLGLSADRCFTMEFSTDSGVTGKRRLDLEGASCS